MNDQEFAEESDAVLAPIPAELRSALAYMAYERGHSAGRDEVLGILKGLVSDLQAPLANLVRRLTEQPNNKVEYRYANGMPLKPDTVVVPDHFVTTFRLGIRSQRAPSAETIRDLIQTRHEVTIADQTACVCIAKG